MDKLKQTIENIIENDVQWEIGLFTAPYIIHVDDNSPERHKALQLAGKIKPFEAISIGTLKGQICFVPLDESNKETAELISNLPQLLKDMGKMLDCMVYQKKLIDEFERQVPVVAHKIMMVDEMILVEKLIDKYK